WERGLQSGWLKPFSRTAGEVARQRRWGQAPAKPEGEHGLPLTPTLSPASVMVTSGSAGPWHLPLRPLLQAGGGIRVYSTCKRSELPTAYCQLQTQKTPPHANHEEALGLGIFRRRSCLQLEVDDAADADSVDGLQILGIGDVGITDR